MDFSDLRKLKSTHSIQNNFEEENFSGFLKAKS